VFLDEWEEIPWQALNYLAAETNYGGRVTDPRDRRLLSTLLSDFYDPKILLESYRFSPSGVYFAPSDGPL
jgi:dynein heavy chain